MTHTRAARMAAVVIGMCAIGPVGAAPPNQTPTGGGNQPPSSGRGAGQNGPQAPAFVSPDVLPDRRITFRIFAPRADEVRLVGTDIPKNPQGMPLTKANTGVC